MFLRELTQPVSQLKGIGPYVSKQLLLLDITSIADLLTHYPRSYIDKSTPSLLNNGFKGEYVNTRAEVIAHDYIGFGNKKTLKVYVRDESATAALVCFGRNFLSQKLRPGNKIYLSGFFQYRYGELQSSNFDFEPVGKTPRLHGRVLPVYPLAGSLTQSVLRKSVQDALNRLGGSLEDEVPEEIRRNYGLLCKSKAISDIHFPDSLQSAEKARQTLVFEELFNLQLSVGRRALLRKTVRQEKIDLPFNLQETLISQLPFTLTKDQETALETINRDLNDTKPMSRLLQGEVGSGKTLVAFLSALPLIEFGYQAAFMAPTELLARQHAENADRLLSPLGIKLAFLSGTIKDRVRESLLDALAAGEIDLVIGTHAIFTEDVQFKSLRYVIVDEQHRFGVLQRLALIQKGTNPDLLLMTATPIPRTLALTVFGDMDVSSLITMPSGRKKVITHLAREGNEKKVYDRIRLEIENGHQAYFVYPLITESENISLKDAENMYTFLKNEIYPQFRSGLIHSRLGEEEKNDTMRKFKDGELDILVATSVVEVGVDIKNATCMVIEHAERFGLSALHQLRGRVGRGTDQGYAFLIYAENLTEDAKKRLKTILEHTDGFSIAEEDLKIRGPGDLSGTIQSGFLKLSIADVQRDMQTMLKAREEAFKIIEKDPGLLMPEHTMLKKLNKILEVSD